MTRSQVTVTALVVLAVYFAAVVLAVWSLLHIVTAVPTVGWLPWFGLGAATAAGLVATLVLDELRERIQ